MHCDDNRSKPEDVMSLVDEKVELNKIRMNFTDNPKVLLEKITSVKKGSAPNHIRSKRKRKSPSC